MNLMMRNLKSALFIFFVLFLANTGLLLGAKDSDQASKIYTESSKSVLMIVVRSEKGEVVGQATGFVVEGGKVVTNEHVVRNGNVVIDLGAVKLPAKVERIDAFNDIALLSIGAELSLKPLSVGNISPKPGMSVYVIGNPAGLEKSLSSGIVSGVRDFNGRQLLQITAPISPGSSGGPVLNSRGEVVGVAVGMLDKGQNLNFAVPSVLLRKLLDGEVRQANSDVLSLLNKLEDLKKRRDQVGYSDEPASDWQNLERQINSVLESALTNAGTDNTSLLKIAEQAEWQNTDLSIIAADRAILAKPTPEGYLRLGKGLKAKAILVADDTVKAALQERAEKALRTALRLSKQPSATVHYHLADVLEDRAINSEAESNFRRALDLSKKSEEKDLQASSLRGLVRTTYSQGKQNESDTWFKALVDAGIANSFDWAENGRRLNMVNQYSKAALSFKQAALEGGSWIHWCEAGASLTQTVGEEDAELFYARKCISEGLGKKGSESQLIQAHKQIASVLNFRGVYQEALSHAREATAINPADPWAYNILAKALLGLRRFQEAINASSQAIRLSDGKYSFMHFNLGSAYFGAENWSLAMNSFQKASELDPKDHTAAYNVAVCNGRLGYYRDAANWYEEVLRRNPSHPNRQSILDTIKVLSR